MERREGYRWRRGGWQPTDRQREVLDLLVEGKTNGEIAVRLSITIDGAKWHVSELLAEVGVEDRQTLASWWREERDRPSSGAFWTGLLPRRVAIGSAVVILTMMAVAGLLLTGGKGGSDEETPEEDAVGQDGGFLTGGEIELGKPQFQEFLVELTVEAPNADSRVDLRALETGEVLASVEAGYRPMVVVRQEAQELLVSSGRRTIDGDGFANVLEVFDLAGYSMTLKRTITLPDRVNCTTYCQPMVLSNDERFLYYDSVRSICPNGGDASVCDAHAIAILDLEAQQPSVSASLPSGCGIPILNPAGPQATVVTCRGQFPADTGWMALIGSDGTILSSLDFSADRPFNREMVISGMKVTASFGAQTAGGDMAVILGEGQIIKMAPNGDKTFGQVLPEDSQFIPRVENVSDLDDDRLFIVYQDNEWSAHDTYRAFVVVDLRAMSIEGVGHVPRADHYLPQGESVYVLRSGQVEVLDLASGRLSKLADVSESVEVLLPGR